jgi:hypothetical protein
MGWGSLRNDHLYGSNRERREKNVTFPPLIVGQYGSQTDGNKVFCIYKFVGKSYLDLSLRRKRALGLIEMQDKRSSPLVMPDRRHVIESGKMEMQPELVCCQEVLDEVSAVLCSLTQAKGLCFDIVVPITQIKIQTDRQALRQILLDLTDSAIRLTDSGGICIELRRCMDRDFTRVSTEFSVEGMSVGLQLVQQMKPGNPTIHLLPQSQGLARLIGGRIETMSIPGQGSIFRLVLSGKQSPR